MTWPPDPDSLGAITIDVTPVIGGTSGDFLKVGATGKLEQSTIAGIGVVIGEAVTGGDPNDILFVGATGLLDQSDLFQFIKASKRFQLGSGVLQRFTPSTADADAGLSWMELLPAPDPGPSQHPSFDFYALRALFGATYDHTVGIGWNAKNQDPAFGRIWDTWESDFDSSGGAGPILSERHLSFAKPGGTEHRFLTFTGNWATEEIRGASAVDNFHWETHGGAVYLTLQANGFDFLTPFAFRNNTNNAPWLYQASSGGPFRSLMLLNSLDQVQLGPGAQPVFMDGLVHSANSVLVGEGDGTKSVSFFSNDYRIQSVLGLDLYAPDQINLFGGGSSTGKFNNTGLVMSANRLVDTSANGATVAQLKLKKTTDVPALLPTVYFKVYDEGNNAYYLPGYPLGA